MPNQKKTKHHYVNAGYLRLFSIPNNGDKYSSFIWVYRKEKIIHMPSKKSVRSICHKDKYYSYIKENGSIDLSVLEDKFAEIENLAIKLIRTLNTTASKVNISSKDKGLLAFYIGLMFSRGPSFRDGIKKLHKCVIEDLLSIYARNNPPPFEYNGNIADLVDIQVLEQVSLNPMIKLASVVSESILQKYWQFQRSCDDTNFITSDTPVVMANSINERAPCHPLTEFIFPLRKDLCLICTHTNPDPNDNNLIFDVSSRKVSRLNEVVARAASLEIYASENSDQIAALATKYHGICQKFDVN